MTLRYAATFQQSLGRLTLAEQKQVKVTTVDLMFDPSDIAETDCPADRSCDHGTALPAPVDLTRRIVERVQRRVPPAVIAVEPNARIGDAVLCWNVGCQTRCLRPPRSTKWISRANAYSNNANDLPYTAQPDYPPNYLRLPDHVTGWALVNCGRTCPPCKPFTLLISG